MKAIAAAIAALTMVSTAVQAADYGIGVSVQSNDSVVYVPVELNDRFRIEPSVRYVKSEIEDFFGGEIEQEQLEVGIGLFGLSAVNKSVRLYYGARVSYIDQEETQAILALPSAALPGVVTPAAVSVQTTIDSDGYRIAPTIGFEFLFNERLSLGGEAAYFYQDIDGDLVSTETSGTDTRLILRFKF